MGFHPMQQIGCNLDVRPAAAAQGAHVPFLFHLKGHLVQDVVVQPGAFLHLLRKHFPIPDQQFGQPEIHQEAAARMLGNGCRKAENSPAPKRWTNSSCPSGARRNIPHLARKDKEQARGQFFLARARGALQSTRTAVLRDFSITSFSMLSISGARLRRFSIAF